MNVSPTIDVEQRVLRARELFLSGYNCSQAVFGALADIYGISDEQAARLSASFGGGVGRLREMLQLRKDAPTPPTPDERTAEYYRQRPCLRMVESAVRIYCERLQGK